MNVGQILYTTILYPLTQLIELSFFLFDKLFDNVGIATLGVSLTVTLLCLPLYIVAESWEETERNIQLKMKPVVDRIKSVFKGDEQYMILTTYYRQNHYHPMMALRSSFGILIQVPFFMAAYSCLSHLESLQGTPFLFIRDMGKPDAIFSIGGFSVNILPITMTLINCISGTIYSKGHAIREKLQIYGMAALFLVVLYDSPAGLVLYWTMNNIFSLVKNIFYKMKNPLKVLHMLLIAGVSFVSAYIIFFYGGSAKMAKRIPAAIALLALIPIPYFVKGIEWLLKNPLKPLMESKALRFRTFAFSSIALCLLTGLIIPSTMMSTSVQEFSNIDSFGSPTDFLYFSFWQSFGIFIFWSTCVFFLFKNKIQTLLGLIYSILLIGGIVNAYAFAGNYGTMDVTLKFIDGIQKQTNLFILFNTVSILIIPVLVIYAFAKSKSRIVTSFGMLAILIFAILSVINTSKIRKDYKEYQKIVAERYTDNSMTPKFHLSKNGKNIILLMLDRCESSFFESIVAENPDFNRSFSGFTFYPNTISFNGHTLMGSPAVYGGYEYTPLEMNRRSDKLLKDKHNEALLVLPKLLTENADYTATLSDLSWANYSYVSDMTFLKNYKSDKITGLTLNARYTGDFKASHPGLSKITLSTTLIRNLLWVSFFRTSPSLLRNAIYYKGSYLNGTSLDGDDNFLDWYSALYYMKDLTDFSSDTNQFFMITNEATHFAKSIDNLNLIDRTSLLVPTYSYSSNTVVLKEIASFLDYLKENNAYDNTKIIIVADHGIGDYFFYQKYSNNEYRIDGYMKDHFNPILLVKDFNENHEIAIDNTFMTNADVPSLILDKVIDHPNNPFTENPINMEPKKNGAIITAEELFMPYHSKSKYVFTCSDDSWWVVKDNIFESSNWTRLNKE